MYGSFTGELWVYVQVLSRVRRLRLVSAESIVSTTANTRLPASFISASGPNNHFRPTKGNVVN